nr:carbon-nitrogen hydrolase family protein [Methanocella paludicola]
MQMTSRLGMVEENIGHATRMIEDAAGQGAKMVVLPEMCMTGYTLTKQAWDMAEPAGGPIEQWLTSTSKRLGIYLGAGLVGCEGEDFYNTYLLADPQGKAIGRVRKTQTEYDIFKAGDMASHVIDTDIGRIGVGICADNHVVFLPKLMEEKGVDILLMPHAWPTPYRTSKLISEQDIKEQNDNAHEYALLFSMILGIPVVFVNQAGPIEGGRWPGILGRVLTPEYFRYPGLSAIVDSDKSIKAQTGHDEGIIVADVTMDPARKHKAEIPDYGGWLHPGAFPMRKIVMPLEIYRGKISYKLSGERKRKALACNG